MVVFLWSYYGEKSENPEKTHLSNLVTTNHHICWCRGSNLGCTGANHSISKPLSTGNLLKPSILSSKCFKSDVSSMNYLSLYKQNTFFSGYKGIQINTVLLYLKIQTASVAYISVWILNLNATFPPWITFTLPKTCLNRTHFLAYEFSSVPLHLKKQNAYEAYISAWFLSFSLATSELCDKHSQTTTSVSY